jgi:hypothetical protein
LAERLRDGRFHVVCVGQFKRGRSTLINALVGEDALPTGVVPVTSVVTVLRHGERLLEVNSARIENDFGDRVVESRRLLAGDLKRRLAEVSAAADRPQARARHAGQRGRGGSRAPRVAGATARDRQLFE